jgi:thiol-disulfide isomerase/thioredoxin
MVSVFTVAAFAENPGDDAPPLNRPEVIDASGTLGSYVNIDDFLGKTVLVNFWKKSCGSCIAELPQLETDIYDVYHTEGAGCEVLTVNCWDSAADIGHYKFTYYGHTLPMYFLDGESADYSTWYLDGYIPLNYVVGVNGLIYYGDAGYSESAISSAIERTIYPDSDPPYVLARNPTDGASDVPVTRNIACHVKDAGFGVEESSLEMTVTVPGRGEVEGNLTISGNFLDFGLTLDPYEDLPYGTEVTVEVDAKDLEGNVMPTETWSFTTESDASIAPASFGHIKVGFAE